MWLVWFMVFNVTINNISVVSWWSVLVVGETGIPGENHRPAAISIIINQREKKCENSSTQNWGISIFTRINSTILNNAEIL